MESTMTMQKTKLRCPFCGSETVEVGEYDVCAMCGTTMKEWKQCECCGEYSIPEDVCADYCDTCRSGVQKKLYDFLKANFTEKEIKVLDETVEDSFYWFIKGYEEEHGIE